MATKVDQSVVVSVPVQTAYNQWTQFEDFPRFMSGISEVRQIDDVTLHWVAEIGGVRREWEARILEQVPDRKVAWAATEGATNAGAVYFSPAGEGRTNVRLELEYEPEGVVESVADRAGLISRRIDGDLSRFKSFIEDAGHAEGAWRGTVAGRAGSPGVEAAAGSRGDSGRAGVSPRALVFGAVGAAVALAGLFARAKARLSVDEVRIIDAKADRAVPDIASTARRPRGEVDRERAHKTVSPGGENPPGAPRSGSA